MEPKQRLSTLAILGRVFLALGLADRTLLLSILGLGLIVAGAWVLHPAAGLICAGVAVLVLEGRLTQ